MKRICRKTSGNGVSHSDYREQIEVLARRVSMLTGKDKVIMTMRLENGSTYSQLAKLCGVSEETISRRIRRIAKRLMNCKYIFCLRNRNKFIDEEMEVAHQHYLHGVSIRKLAQRRGCTRYQIRRILDRIEKEIKLEKMRQEFLIATRVMK